jgi:hypothetical protein
MMFLGGCGITCIESTMGGGIGREESGVQFEFVKPVEHMSAEVKWEVG